MPREQIDEVAPLVGGERAKVAPGKLIWFAKKCTNVSLFGSFALLQVEALA